MRGGSSRGSGWTSFDLDVLVEPTANENERGEEGAQPDAPYPSQKNEIIGGDSVESIEQRLLAKYDLPPAHEITMARIEAEDLFEVKVEIIQRMAVLDPSGDWTGRGARALDNPRTASGEPSLIELYRLRVGTSSLREESNPRPLKKRLQKKVFTRVENLDENSTA